MCHPGSGLRARGCGRSTGDGISGDPQRMCARAKLGLPPPWGDPAGCGCGPSLRRIQLSCLNGQELAGQYADHDLGAVRCSPGRKDSASISRSRPASPPRGCFPWEASLVACDHRPACPWRGSRRRQGCARQRGRGQGPLVCIGEPAMDDHIFVVESEGASVPPSTFAVG